MNERNEEIETLMERVRKFPKTQERKDIIFESLNKIIYALGSYLNDPEAELTRETDGDREFLVWKSVYGTYKQSITYDSEKGFFEDALKLLLSHVRELNGVKESLIEDFNNLDKE